MFLLAGDRVLERVIASKRTAWPAAPGRVYRAPWSLVAGADPAGGDVVVELDI